MVSSHSLKENICDNIRYPAERGSGSGERIPVVIDRLMDKIVRTINREIIEGR
jgi:hypothetical protein